MIRLDVASSTIKNWLDSAAPTNFRLWAGFTSIELGLLFWYPPLFLIGLGMGLIVWQLAVMEDPEEIEGG